MQRPARKIVKGAIVDDVKWFIVWLDGDFFSLSSLQA